MQKGHSMNIHTRNVNTQPDQNAVEEALDILRNWVGHADETEIASLDADLLAQILPQQYHEFSASYNSDFTVNEAYRDSMPDLQNGPTALIRGAKKRSSMLGFQISGCRFVTKPAMAQTRPCRHRSPVQSALMPIKRASTCHGSCAVFTAMLRKVLVLM